MPALATSARLQLHDWEPADAQAFFELTRDPGFGAYSITDYAQADLFQARRWIERNAELRSRTGLGKWAVRLKSEQALLGMGGLTPWDWEGEALVDITYRLRQSAWGRGIGGELSQLLLSYGLKLGLCNLTATITPDNAASLHLIEKLGFRLDRRIILLGVETLLYRYSHKTCTA